MKIVNFVCFESLVARDNSGCIHHRWFRGVQTHAREDFPVPGLVPEAHSNSLVADFLLIWDFMKIEDFSCFESLVTRDNPGCIHHRWFGGVQKHTREDFPALGLVREARYNSLGAHPLLISDFMKIEDFSCFQSLVARDKTGCIHHRWFGGVQKHTREDFPALRLVLEARYDSVFVQTVRIMNLLGILEF